MAEHQHAMLIRRGYEAFSRGDMDAMRGLMTGDCAQHVPGSHPLSGDFKGVDAIIDLYGRLHAETGGTLRVELRSVLVDGRGHAVAMHRFSGDRGGKHIDENACIVFRIVGDRISDLDECLEDIDKADAFWS